MDSLKFVKDKAVKTQIQKFAAANDGKWPDSVLLRFSIPTEIAIEFLNKFNSKKYLRRMDRNRISKADLAATLFWIYARGEDVIDFKKDLFEQVYGNKVYEPRVGKLGRHLKKPVKPKDPNERRGRKPKKQLIELPLEDRGEQG